MGTRHSDTSCRFARLFPAISPSPGREALVYMESTTALPTRENVIFDIDMLNIQPRQRFFITLQLIVASPQFIQRSDALLEPFFSRYPELVTTFHNVRQHGTSQEHHVFPSRRIFDFDFEFLTKICEADSTKTQKSKTVTFNLVGSPPKTRVRYNCFISLSRREGRPGYMLDPPESTMCL